jgi:hypothetical protein
MSMHPQYAALLVRVTQAYRSVQLCSGIIVMLAITVPSGRRSVHMVLQRPRVKNKLCGT